MLPCIIVFLLLNLVAIFAAPLPYHIHQMHTLPFHGTLGTGIYFRTPRQLISEKLQRESWHHDAKGNGFQAIKNVLDIPKKDRYKYMSHLLNNPTVDLSAHDHHFAKTLVQDGDVHSLSLIAANNPKYDLSFNDNQLLKLASSSQKSDIVQLLLHDQMVTKLLNPDITSEIDDELESLGFSKTLKSDSEITALTQTTDNSSVQSEAQTIEENNDENLIDILSSHDGETLEDVDDISDIGSIKISLGLSEKEIKSDQDEYQLVDHDEDWEYLGSDDDDQSIGTKELISLLSLMKG
jgi:hypothetical protein